MIFPGDLQTITTIALIVDAFILGATWQVLSNRRSRKKIQVQKGPSTIR